MKKGNLHSTLKQPKQLHKEMSQEVLVKGWDQWVITPTKTGVSKNRATPKMDGENNGNPN